MARVATITFCLVLAAWSTSSTEIRNNLNLEEQLKQWENKYEDFKKGMEERIVVLENQLQEKKIDKKEGKTSLFRTCHELRAADPSINSGMHWIDPDGQNVGEEPIQVYCDINTGTTSILHDTEMQTDVGHCLDPGCYSKAIRYQASDRQIEGLKQLSTECHQSFKYDCSFAPFEFNDIQYAWWNDRNGNPHYYWAGSDDTTHTCDCGIKGDCFEPSTKCNCDSLLPIPVSDFGIITNKNQLPISQLNFGRTEITSSGFHTLGRFECSGQVTVSGVPTSCADLSKIGHTLNGIYSIKTNDLIETVFCDFTKLNSDPSIQTSFGYPTFKTASVYFYVQRDSSFTTWYQPITFQITRLNYGEAMDAGSGIFTAPVGGIYFFSFSAVGYMDRSASDGHVEIALIVNSNEIGQGRSHFTQGVNYQTQSIQSTLHLNAGDRVWLEMVNMVNEVWLHDSGAHYTHFTGLLIESD